MTTDGRVVGVARAVDGRRARWAGHRVIRRGELIEATIAAVRRHGAGVGMDQIAAEAHTSKPVIYRYFSDKADLYRAVGSRLADDLAVDIAAATAHTADPHARLAAWVDAFTTVLERDPEVYRFVVTHPVLDNAHTTGRYPVVTPAALAAAASGSGPAGTVADYLYRVEQLLTRLLLDQPALGLGQARAQLWAACIVGQLRAAGEWWLDERAAAERAAAAWASGGPEPSVPPTRAELTAEVTTLLWGGMVGSLLGPVLDGPPMPEPAAPPAGRPPTR